MSVSLGMQAPAGYEPLGDLLVAGGDRADLERIGLTSLDALCASGGDDLDKAGLPAWRKRRRIKIKTETGERSLYLKTFGDAPRRALEPVRRLAGKVRSLAGVEWYWSRRLIELNIPTFRVVAFGERIQDGRPTRSAVLSEAVPGRSLEAWAQQWTTGDRSSIEAAASGVCDIARKLHAAGLVHRDFYLSHLYFDPAAPKDRRVHLIDLNRVMAPRFRAGRWIVKDLAALNYSAPAELAPRGRRLAWLLAYLGATCADAKTRRLLLKIQRKTSQIARHDARRRARIAKEGGGR